MVILDSLIAGLILVLYPRRQDFRWQTSKFSLYSRGCCDSAADISNATTGSPSISARCPVDLHTPHLIRTVMWLTLTYEAVLTLIKPKEAEHEFVLSEITADQFAVVSSVWWLCWKVGSVMIYWTITSDKTDPFVVIQCIKTRIYKEAVLNNKAINKSVTKNPRGVVLKSLVVASCYHSSDDYQMFNPTPVFKTKAYLRNVAIKNKRLMDITWYYCIVQVRQVLFIWASSLPPPLPSPTRSLYQLTLADDGVSRLRYLVKDLHPKQMWV